MFLRRQVVDKVPSSGAIPHTLLIRLNKVRQCGTTFSRTLAASCCAPNMSAIRVQSRCLSAIDVQNRGKLLTKKEHLYRRFPLEPRFGAVIPWDRRINIGWNRRAHVRMDRNCSNIGHKLLTSTISEPRKSRRGGRCIKFYQNCFISSEDARSWATTSTSTSLCSISMCRPTFQQATEPAHRCFGDLLRPEKPECATGDRARSALGVDANGLGTSSIAPARRAFNDALMTAMMCIFSCEIWRSQASRSAACATSSSTSPSALRLHVGRAPL
jgi:hypothetical protein